MGTLINLVILVLVVIAVIDIVKSSASGGQKALWIAVSVLLGPIGVAVYFFWGKKKLAGGGGA